MKKIEKWACDKCGSTYDSSVLAEACEASHIAPRRIADATWDCPWRMADKVRINYPGMLTVEMADGTSLLYSFTGRRADEKED